MAGVLSNVVEVGCTTGGTTEIDLGVDCHLCNGAGGASELCHRLFLLTYIDVYGVGPEQLAVNLKDQLLQHECLAEGDRPSDVRLFGGMAALGEGKLLCQVIVLLDKPLRRVRGAVNEVTGELCWQTVLRVVFSLPCASALVASAFPCWKDDIVQTVERRETGIEEVARVFGQRISPFLASVKGSEIHVEDGAF